jgi:putative SOS response-associated peptidase YedK
MCHHFSLVADEALLLKQFYAATHPGHQSFPFGSFYPLSRIPVIRLNDQGVRELVPMEWGLLPPWWKPSGRKTARSGFQRGCFNARSVEIHAKRSYKSPFARRRCLLIGTEFMEGDRYFFLPDKPLLAFAGIWELWRSDEEQVLSCSMLTTAANAEVLAAGNDRMPLVLETDEARAQWLDQEIVERGPLDSLMIPAADGTFQSRPKESQQSSGKQTEQKSLF